MQGPEVKERAEQRPAALLTGEIAALGGAGEDMVCATVQVPLHRGQAQLCSERTEMETCL